MVEPRPDRTVGDSNPAEYGLPSPVASCKLTLDHRLEEVQHDLSMPGRDSGPQSACDAVVQLYEGGEEQCVLLAFEEQFA
jgi:hypothetical protein